MGEPYRQRFREGHEVVVHADGRIVVVDESDSHGVVDDERDILVDGGYCHIPLKDGMTPAPVEEGIWIARRTHQNLLVIMDPTELEDLCRARELKAN